MMAELGAPRVYRLNMEQCVLSQGVPNSVVLLSFMSATMFTRLNAKKHYSEVFVVGGFKWRVLIFPKANNVDYLSMYLDVADSPSLPYGWSRYAQFSLAVVNQIHNKYSMRKGCEQDLDGSQRTEWLSDKIREMVNLGYLMKDIFDRRINLHLLLELKKMKLPLQGDEWWDLCAGPHVESTGTINRRAIELQSVAGAYWRVKHQTSS